MEHFVEIILKLGHGPRRRCHLKAFLFLALAAIVLKNLYSNSQEGTFHTTGLKEYHDK